MQAHRAPSISAVLLLFTLASGNLVQAQEPGEISGRWRTLNGAAPLVIGHRGASGYLPEHTIAAYRRAIEMGADFVEPDIVATRDGRLIARHEPLLDGTTDVASRSEFASKRTTKLLDGVRTTGFYASDFTLAEIKRLRALQPMSGRPQEFNGQYEIPTLEEIIDLTIAESSRLGRTIGIYPETKHPTFHFVNGVPLEDNLLRTLERYGWTSRNSPVIVQSFEVANLKYLRTRTNVRLVQLIDANDVALNGALTYEAPCDRPYDFTIAGDARLFGDLLRAADLAEIRTYADGIGPWKRHIVTVQSRDSNNDGRADDVNGDGAVNDSDRQAVANTLIDQAHAAGLFVHAYTFRNERGTLAANYAGEPRNEYTQFYLLGVDGVFSDFPDTAFAARQAVASVLP